MKIMKLNKTLYFDDTGNQCDSYIEAKQCSYRQKDIEIIKPQKCKVYEINEMTKEELFGFEERNYYIYSMKGNLLFGTNTLNDFEDIKE